MSEPWQDWDRYCDRVEEREYNATMEDYEEAQDRFEDLVKLLYGSEPINPNTLDSILTDLASSLKVDSALMKHLPTVQRVGKDVPMLYEVSRDLL